MSLNYPVSIQGFIHVACMGRYQEIADELFHCVIHSGLAAKSKVNVIKLGTGKLDVPEEFNLLLTDDDLTRYEYPTLRLAWEFSQNNDAHVWYIHSKGVSKIPETWEEEKRFWEQRCNYPSSFKAMSQNCYEWRKFMSYFILNRYRDCLRELNHSDACGVAYRSQPMPHFSGNFWWANTEYLRTLPDPETLRNLMIDENGRDRYMAEFWIGYKNPVVKDLFPHKHNIYLWGINPAAYRPLQTFL